MYVVVFITTSNMEEAEEIGRSLLEKKMAACISIIPKIYSIFWWKKKIESCEESLLIVKTKYDVLEDLIRFVKSIHRYEVPEIIALPVKKGLQEYLSWIEETVTGNR